MSTHPISFRGQSEACLTEQLATATTNQSTQVATQLAGAIPEHPLASRCTNSTKVRDKEIEEAKSKLHRFIEESEVYYKDNGNQVEVFYGEHKVKAEITNGEQVRLVMHTNIFATPETEAQLRATMEYLSGWKYKIAFFDFTSEEEVVLYYDRDMSGVESAAEMLQRLRFTLQDGCEYLEKAAKGAKPRAAMGLTHPFSLEQLLRENFDSLTGAWSDQQGSILAELAANDD